MTTFDDRERAFETKYSRDQEMQFRVIARRNKLLGLWAASLLGKSGEEADAYAKSVVLSDFQEAGDDDVLRKVRGDLEAAGKPQTDGQIRRTMDELLARAVQEIQAGR